MKRIIMVLLMIYLILMCGCMDKHELEDSNFVILIGIDKEQEDIRITISFPLSQLREKMNEYETVSATDDNAVKALKKLEENMAGKIALHSIKTLAVSKDIVQNGELECVYNMWKQTEMRNTAAVVITECSAKKFVSARVENALTDPLRQEELLLEREKPVQLIDFIANFKFHGKDISVMYGNDEGEVSACILLSKGEIVG